MTLATPTSRRPRPTTPGQTPPELRTDDDRAAQQEAGRSRRAAAPGRHPFPLDRVVAPRCPGRGRGRSRIAAIRVKPGAKTGRRRCRAASGGWRRASPARAYAGAPAVDEDSFASPSTAVWNAGDEPDLLRGRGGEDARVAMLGGYKTMARSTGHTPGSVWICEMLPHRHRLSGAAPPAAET